MHGCFEMDYSDGEIRFRTSLFCDDTIPTYEQIKYMFYGNILSIEKYGDALTKVMYGMASPQDAIEEAEV